MFADVGPSLLEGNLIPGVNFTDLTCNYSFNVEQFSNGYDGMKCAGHVASPLNFLCLACTDIWNSYIFMHLSFSVGQFT